MSNFSTDSRTTIGPVTVQFVHFSEPHAKDDERPKYSCMVVIDKDDTDSLGKIEQAVKAAHKNGADKLGKSTLKAIRTPLRDGEEKDGEEYEGKMFFNCSSIRMPKVVGTDRKPIMDDDEIYSGMVGYISLNAFAYKAAQSKGIGMGLNNFMKTADGVRFGGGGTSIEDDFADVSIDDIM